MPATPEIIPLSVAFASVAVAAITYVLGPSITAWIKRRAAKEGRENTGWAKAVEHLEERVDDLVGEVEGLRSEVASLRKEVSEKDQRIAEQARTIADQSRLLARANGRVVQLEASWPPGFTMPVPDPAHS